MLKTIIRIFLSFLFLHHFRNQREVQLDKVERTSLFSHLLNYTNSSIWKTYKNLNHTQPKVKKKKNLHFKEKTSYYYTTIIIIKRQDQSPVSESYIIMDIKKLFLRVSLGEQAGTPSHVSIIPLIRDWCSTEYSASHHFH